MLTFAVSGDKIQVYMASVLYWLVEGEIMKYCSRCGHEVIDEAEYCPNCGCRIASTASSSGNGETLRTVAKVFMIISCVVSAFAIIPLAWCIPMTVVYSNKVKNKEKAGMGFKICTLLFVNVVSGILMLCDEEG